MLRTFVAAGLLNSPKYKALFPVEKGASKKKLKKIITNKNNILG
jgi:hypothetical protein